jgi:2-dehydro-3-deoxygluconokinase
VSPSDARGAQDTGAFVPGSGSPGSGPLIIRPDGEFDLLSLGGLVVRLDTGLVPFRKATDCRIHVSGAEYNVAANVSDCFGLRTAIASAMVDYPVGELVAERVRAMGVTGLYRHFEHDGVAGPNIATVYSDRGVGMRPPVVFYNRANEAAALLRPGDFDWAAIFGRGVRWFHSGGLFAALSETAPEVLVEAMTAARAHGTIVSCDLNYRAKLWARLGGEARAREVMSGVVGSVDVLVGNEEDVGLSLGISQPEASRSSDPDPKAFEAVSERVVERYPNVKIVATTLRHVVSASRHQWSAVVWADGQLHQAPTMDLDVYDRVGGGDGFASGLFYGLLAGHSIEESLRLGWAHGALLTSYPGDTTMATLAQVKALASGGSARIQR